jgi:DNA-binding response OmpR family regulator
MRRVLVVDDERDIADVLHIGLERAGFKTTVAYDPDDALKKFSGCEYDTVILDVMMPVMDGYALYRKMLEINPKIKVCFLTGFDIPYLDGLDKEQCPIHNIHVAKKPILCSELARILLAN